MARLILIADDSPTIQRRAQRILEGEGYAVETVSNGVAAIKKLPQLHPALVLADVSMPGKDGYEVCEFVKTSNDLFHVPVLLVGSDLEPYDEPRGAEVKADGIIKKPFTPLDLIAVVSKYISAAEASAYQPAPPETQVESSAAEQPGVSHEAQGTETSPCAQELDSASPSPEAPIAQEPELAAVPLGSLPESGLERAPEPIPETLPQSFAEAHLAGPPGEEPGSSSEATHPTADPFPEFELGQTGRSTEEDIQQAEPSPVWMSPEPASSPFPSRPLRLARPLWSKRLSPLLSRCRSWLEYVGSRITKSLPKLLRVPAWLLLSRLLRLVLELNWSRRPGRIPRRFLRLPMRPLH